MAGKFETLEELFEFHGRSNLIAIDNLRQIIFYTARGYQPEAIFEHEKKNGKITCWYLKNDTSRVYKQWMESTPNKEI